MKLLDAISDEYRGERYACQFNAMRVIPALDESVIDTGHHPSSDVSSTKYQLRATLTVDYWANTAQKEQARERAIKLLQRTIYEDILLLSSQLHDAVEKGDKSLCHKLIDKLDDLAGI
ncbi:MAG: hypothetical protein GY743_04315 [Planctomycetaceae bacterium]|nr:hypothetical protein [Planctomycetaceae bacterium]